MTAESIRARGSGHYEIVLLLVVVIIVLTPLESSGMRAGFVALLGTAFIFAFWTSGARPWVVAATSGLAVAAMLLAAVGLATGGAVARGLFAVTGIVLSGGADVAIFHHLAAQRRVTRHTVTGALSVYLLSGLLFAYVYALIDVAAQHGFFAQSGKHGVADYVYFSYVTLTTVGYGDLTAASSLGRVIAVLEALIGQLYLVTIVAIVVGNIGRERAGSRHREPAEGEEAPSRSGK